MTKIVAPTNCPSCNSLLEWNNHILYCVNSDCTNKVAKKLEHFARTMKVKGLGPQAIYKLGLNSITDIYCLEEDYISESLGSLKLAQKLKQEIDNSKKAPLNQILPAFGIRLIGRTASEKLSFVCENIFDINEDTCQQAGLGPKAIESLMDWVDNDFYKYADLPFSFKFERGSKKSTAKICISGKLTSFKTKAEAKTALEALGYEVKDNLTREVKILVNESGIESSKTKKARESGVTIVENLTDFIGENT